MSFSDYVRSRSLLWSDRHCCLCRKACGAAIEVHHIDPNGEDALDNAIPLCFECHARVQHYNDDHPRGNKYRPVELKARREQVYEEHTRHLVPPIHYEVTQQLPNERAREFPDVGFNITHCSDGLPVKARVTITQVTARKRVKIDGHLGGRRMLHLNPRLSIRDHFVLPHPFARPPRLHVAVVLIDELGREHMYLPIQFVFDRQGLYWYLEPFEDGA